MVWAKGLVEGVAKGLAKGAAVGVAKGVTMGYKFIKLVLSFFWYLGWLVGHFLTFKLY